MSLENVILELTKVIEANTMALLSVESPAATAIAADTLKTAVTPVAAAVAVTAPVAAAPVTAPVTAPVAAAVVAPVAAAVAPVETTAPVEAIISDVAYDGVDKEGVGWDERIHSSNGKKVKKSGLWMRKKGMAASNPEAQEIHKLLLQIAEAVAAGGGPPATPAPVIATNASPGDAVALIGVAAPVAQAPVDIPAPLVFPAAANPADLQHADLENVMAYFTEFHGQTMCAEILAQWNMASMADLPADLYIDFYNYMLEQDAANK